MGVLNNVTVDAATQAANQIRSIARQQFNQLAQSGKQGYELIWANRNATPQAVVAALGTDAKAVFQLAALNIATVGSAATIGGVTAPSLPSIPSGFSVAFNDDGTATITAVVGVAPRK